MQTIKLGQHFDRPHELALNPFYASDKKTCTGLEFRTYYGLRFYYILGSRYRALLEMDAPTDEIMALIKRTRWEYVPGLSQVLLDTLRVNIDDKPFLRSALRSYEDVIWVPSENEDVTFTAGWSLIVKQYLQER